MHVTQHKSLFSAICNVITGVASVKKPVAEMRPLTDDELRAVAGGPEVEVDNGNG